MQTFSQLAPKSLSILGVRVHNVTSSQTLAILAEFVAQGGFHHVVTVNPEYLVQARDAPDFKAVLNGAALALADGAGLMWAARLLGRQLAARIPGVDLVDWLAALAAAKGHRIFLLGAAPGVAEATAKVLADRHPGLLVAGIYSGSPAPERDDETVARIQASRSHYLFVAYGAPQQDLWIWRNRERLGVQVAIGVGGAFDFISGRVARAPAWMRALGLEWLYRLWREPWRWRRMLRLPRFVWLVLLQRLQGAAESPSSFHS